MDRRRIDLNVLLRVRLGNLRPDDGPYSAGRRHGKQAPPAARIANARLWTGHKLERDARDLDVVARNETGGLERPDHTDPAHPQLEVSHRVLVVSRSCSLAGTCASRSA
jgi:hypothetical protein